MSWNICVSTNPSALVAVGMERALSRLCVGNNITILYRKLTLTVLIAILTNILNLGVFLCVKPAANKKTV